VSKQHLRQDGVGLVTAIFLLVVIAGLAAALVSIFTSQQASSQLDQQGTRAYQAARAGIEWGIFRQVRGGGLCAIADGKTITSTFALPSSSMLGAFTVTVTCTPVGGPGGDATLARTVIKAVACNQPGNAGCPNATSNLDYVQRVVEVQL
jgi:MSHA biogenesis protein MshP